VGISALIRIVAAVVLLAFVVGCSNTGHKSYNVSTYKVRKGETLYSISWKYGLDYKDVARWNGIRPPYRIYKGQELWLSPRNYASSSKSRTSSSASRSSKSTTKKPSTKSSTSTAKSTKKAPSTASMDKSRYPSGKIRWGWPTTGKVISSYSASQPGKKGIDIAGKSGQPVVAAAEGKVVYSGSGLKGYGKLIIIKHNNNYFSAYAHNKKIVVKEGSWVKRGNKIAELGNTGADRTMLHFEIRRNGKPVNPLGYLPRR